MKEQITFEELSIETQYIERLRQRNIVEPTAVQRLAIPRALSGESVVVKSQTGSGKSLAYILPVVQMLAADERRQTLVLLPTRELAQQVGAEFGRLTDMDVAIVYGGVDYEPQRALFARQPRVVVATPGRLEDLIEQGVVTLDEVCCFILDEADQMVDMGFRDAIKRLAHLCSSAAQRLCFSATLSDDVKELLCEVVGEYSLVEDGSQPLAAQSVKQLAYFVESELRDQLLLHLIRTLKPQRAIVFCRSRNMAERICGVLTAVEMSAEVIHSQRSQAAREHIIARFMSGETALLVATDLIARGIHVDGVTHVFNLGSPLNGEQYIHRIGRTGRAGECGEALSLLAPDESRSLRQISTLMRQPIEVVTSHPYMTPTVTLALSGEDRGRCRGKSVRKNTRR